MHLIYTVRSIRKGIQSSQKDRYTLSYMYIHLATIHTLIKFKLLMICRFVWRDETFEFKAFGDLSNFLE